MSDTPIHCVFDPECVHGLHARTDHPCGQGVEKEGEPCRYCGGPIPFPEPCPKCWLPMTVADLKQFAAENGFDTTSHTEPRP